MELGRLDKRGSAWGYAAHTVEWKQTIRLSDDRPGVHMTSESDAREFRNMFQPSRRCRTRHAKRVQTLHALDV